MITTFTLDATFARKKYELRKKMLRIQKEIVKEIIIWFIIDENMSKIMKKRWNLFVLFFLHLCLFCDQQIKREQRKEELIKRAAAGDKDAWYEKTIWHSF